MAGTVRVLLFASARQTAGCAETSVDCGDKGLDEEAFWNLLTERHPALAPLRTSVRLAKNLEYWTAGDRIKPGDEIALIPPVSGG